MMRPPSGSSLILSAAALWLSSACANPAVDVRIEALGEEVEGVEEGPTHRPGQPCALCHSVYGGQDPQMSIAGTVFATRTTGTQCPKPVKDVVVNMVDAQGAPQTATTNEAGNFYVEFDTWNPAFPIYVEILCPIPGQPDADPRRAAMDSWIARDGSCAGCHVGSPNQGSPGWVYCSDVDPGYPDPENKDLYCKQMEVLLQ